MDKLSTLQRLILVALLCPEHLAKTQRERNAELYKLFFDCDTGSDYLATAQALKREDLLNKYGTVERFEHNGLPVTAKKFGDQNSVGPPWPDLGFRSFGQRPRLHRPCQRCIVSNGPNAVRGGRKVEWSGARGTS